MAVPTDVIPRRPTLLFIIVLAVLFFLMSVSSQTRYVGETRTMFERTVMTIFSPVPKLVSRVGGVAQDMYHGYLDMRRAVNENLELRRKVASLTTENLKLRQSEGDLRRLRSLLAYSEQFNLQTSMAQTIMLDTAGRFKSIIIDSGSADGVEVNDVIANANGLVGRVVLTTRDLAKVQLLTDNNCSIGSLIERTRRQGVVRGSGTSALQMFDIPSLSDVQAGDVVLTAGIDGIYPKGIPIGTVVRADPGQSLFKTITVRPSVDFGTIEEVIVIHTHKISENVMRYTP
ncbi:MAG: rod shape-determining protein MreC [Acidobacteria bacterium]|nr:rod shape-determining protein MreC [Acidobacteriota bacterium]MBV9476231.1 rod shape-determining protein MreC [Acidobacteriota bacterium]